MTDQEATATPVSKWYDNQTMLLVWLLVLFPVGLFGLWKTSLFDLKIKAALAVGVLVAFALNGFQIIGPIYLLILFPAALFLLWRDSGFRSRKFYGFGGAWLVVLMLGAFEASQQPTYGGGVQSSGPSCAAVMTEGSCTYFRDDDCNVIARQCE